MATAQSEESVGEPSPTELRMGRRTSAAKQQLAESATDVQKRTFTRWVNAQLIRGKADVKVEDLFKDLRSGVILQKLVGVLAPEASLRREKGKARVHRISNINAVLHYLRSEAKLKLVNIDAEDLVEGKDKLTLGLVWSLIQHFQLGAQEGGLTGLEQKKALLAWCQYCVSDYAGVHVKDLNKSWRDGLAFNALLHFHKPESVDFGALSADNAMENLQSAFDKAKEHFGILQLLDPADVCVKSPDERSIMIYLVLMKGELQPLKKTPDPSPEPTDQPDSGNAELLEWIDQHKDLTGKRQATIASGDVATLQSALDELEGENGERDNKENAASDTGTSDVQESFGELLEQVDSYRAALKEALVAAEAVNESRAKLATNATDLTSWAQKRGQKFQERSQLPSEWKALCRLKKELDDHVGTDRPPQETGKSEVDALFESVLSSPVVTANEDLLRSTESERGALEQAWSTMTEQQPLYAEALNEKMEAVRREATETLDGQHKAFSDWAEVVSKPLAAELPNDREQLQQLVEEFKRQESADMMEHQDQLEKLLDDTKQLGMDGVLDGKAASERYKAREDQWGELKSERDAYWKRLSAALAAAEREQDADAKAGQLREWMSQRNAVFTATATTLPADLSSLRTLATQHRSGYVEADLPVRQEECTSITTALEQSTLAQSADSRQSLVQDWRALQENEKHYVAALHQAMEAATAAEAKQKAELAEFLQWANGKCFEFTNAQEQVASDTHPLSLDQQLANLTSYGSGDKAKRKAALDSLTAVSAASSEISALQQQVLASWKRASDEEASYLSLLHDAARKKRQEEADEGTRTANIISELEAWVATKLTSFDINTVDACSIAELEERVQAFDNAYMKEERLSRQSQYDSVRAAAGEALSGRWQSLEVQQSAYRAALVAALADRSTTVAEFEAWIRQRTAQLCNHNFPSDLASLERLIAAGKQFLSQELSAKNNALNQLAAMHPHDAEPLLPDMEQLRERVYPGYMAVLQDAANAASTVGELRRWMAVEQGVFETDLTGMSRDELDRLALRLVQHESVLTEKEVLKTRAGDAGSTLNAQWNEMHVAREAFKRALQGAIAADDARKDEDDEIGPSVVGPLVTPRDSRPASPSSGGSGAAVIGDKSSSQEGESTPLLGSPDGSPTRSLSRNPSAPDDKEKGGCKCCVIM